MSFYRDHVGLPLEFLISDLDLSSREKDLLIHSFRKDLSKDINQGNIHVFDGVVDALDFLEKKNVVLALATSKPSEIASAVCQNSSLKRFHIHVQGTDDFPAKPSPEVIDRVIQKFPGTRAFMVGDRIEDIQATAAANIPCVGIAAGSHTELDLELMGATLTYLNFTKFSQELLTNPALFTSVFD